MKIIRITDRNRKRIIKKRPLVPSAKEGARIKVLATGCEHCRAMRNNTIEAVRALGLPEDALECISDIESIARLGIMATPTLIIDGEIVSSGKVLPVDTIKRYITEYFEK